jgi:sodium-dependent dicarboxylate transporter 2/3/5
MSAPVPCSPPSQRWWAVVLGPALFLLTELLFRPRLDLAPELLAAAPGASPELVRHALAATLWIAAWWFTEAIPIPATSLLPLVLFPVLGLGEPAEVSVQYGNELVFLFLGGLLIAVALERTGAHRHIALALIRVFGSGRRGLVLGFMVATAAVSMWISNTATTVMLLPVALAVLDSGGEEEAGVDRPFAVALVLGIAYAANIGGLGTPIGSPPNLIFQTIYREKTGGEVSFLQWMAYGVPLIVVLLPLTWLYLVRVLPRGDGASVRLPELGPRTREQVWVLGVFAVAAVLWVTRGNLGELEGWGARLAARGVVVRDSTVAVAAASLLFLLPRREGGRILDWSVAPRLPWGVILLLGAGFAISTAFDRSGLGLWIGSQVEGFGRLPFSDLTLLALLLVVIVAVSLVVTEFASNTASANILLPVIHGAALALGPERFPPGLLMISAALTCTAGFAVPAGTPPNALAFATERVSIGRFVRTGLVIDGFSLVAIVALVLAHHAAG